MSLNGPPGRRSCRPSVNGLCGAGGRVRKRHERRVFTPGGGEGDLYAGGDRFRSRVVMAGHGFGRGEYKYFHYPLPDVVAGLRTELYPHLAAIANRWNESLGEETQYPAAHAAYLKRCHAAGQ